MKPSDQTDIIAWDDAKTLPGLFLRRVERSPDAAAYVEYKDNRWLECTWSQMALSVGRLRAALDRTSLRPGDRVAVLLPNGTDWVTFDIAAMANGLITVPLYTHDSSDNIAYIIANAGARLCLIDTAMRWASLAPQVAEFAPLEHVWVKDGLDQASVSCLGNRRLSTLSEALAGCDLKTADARCSSRDIATIVYTSGTTDRPKGVMLSHSAILWNVEAITKFIPPLPSDVFLSLLPLAHGFERTMGYYLPMMAGSRVSYARSVETLREDLATIRPTVFLGVPRLYERIYEAVLHGAAANPLRRALVSLTADIGWRLHEWRRRSGPAPALVARLILWPLLERLVARRVLAVFGGRLRVAVSGGAALPTEVAHFLVGLGLPLVEGYGLTEAAPVVTATTLEDSLPGSVGRPLHGLDVKLGEEGELLVRSPAVMMGYWDDAQATAKAISPEGWLRTGDIAEIRDGRVSITGRLKDILVLSTGEKVVPTPVETATQRDPLFEQVCVIGDRRSSLVAIAVLHAERWAALAHDLEIDQADPNVPAATEAALSRIAGLTRDLPPYSQVRGIHMILRPWTIQDGILTPTLKIKRRAVEERYKEEINALYARLADLRQSAASVRRG
ncbi:MAG: AMP-dependent synthetase/ligase [Geminicoccaceae bacterium]